MRQCHVGKDRLQMSLFFLEVSGMNVTRSALKGPLYSVVCKAGPAGCAHAWLAEMMLDVTLNPEGLFPERHWWSPPPRKHNIQASFVLPSLAFPARYLNIHTLATWYTRHSTLSLNTQCVWFASHRRSGEKVGLQSLFCLVYTLSCAV